VGTSAVQVAAVLGGEVSAATRASALELVRGLGVREVFDRDTWPVSRPGRRFDVVFDASARCRSGDCDSSSPLVVSV